MAHPRGWLVLNDYLQEATPFDKLSVSRDQTRVWSEGGPYVRASINVKGRELRGVVGKTDYEKFRDEI